MSGLAPGRRRSRIAWAIALSMAIAVGCHRKGGLGGGPAGADSAEGPALAPLALRDDAKNTLLTWVDDHGNFHVVERTQDVPDAGRAAVRVVMSDRADGTGDSVYVANLREKRGDGTYPVKSMARSEWDELGAKNRKARLEALAPSAMPPAAPSSSGAVVAGDVSAIVYGAEWCGPCHQAEALLKSLGVKVTKKDIEENPSAGAEMREKLQRVHRQGGSIPVIDVMGQILVGFSPGALRAAVDHAKRGGTL
jgi:glutaredoxin